MNGVENLTWSIADIEGNDRNFLKEIKSTLSNGLNLFENHQDKTIKNGKDQLTNLIQTQIPSIVKKFFLVEKEICNQYFNGNNLPSDQHRQMQNEEQQHKILSNAYWEMERLPLEDVLILRRTPVNISSLQEFLDINEKLIKTFPKFKNFGIVVDMRQAQGRNDPEFENSMMNLRVNINANFSRVAVLLVSKTGVLQVNRIGRNEGVDNFATVNESAAIRFAKGAA